VAFGPPMGKAPRPKIKKGGFNGVQWAPKLKNGQETLPQTQKSTAGSRVPLILGAFDICSEVFCQGGKRPRPLRPCRRGDG